MPLPASVVAVDLVALVLAVLGFHMAFRQRQLRRWWRMVVPRDPARSPSKQGQADDPAHYALIIFGMMLFAFAIIVILLFTLFSLETAQL